MAEFKPRISEGEDDNADKDSSLVQNWFERMLDDDKPVGEETDKDKKKKKRFGKLFKPIFRMLFPRNEKSGTNASETKEGLLGTNILEINQGDNFESVILPNANVAMSPIDSVEKFEEMADKAIEDNYNLTPPDDDSIETKIPAKAASEDGINEGYFVTEEPQVEAQVLTPPPEEIVATFQTGSQEVGRTQIAGLGQSRDYAYGDNQQPQQREEREFQSLPPEKKAPKESSVLSSLRAELSSRRNERKLKEQQKKLEKQQELLEKEAKTNKVRTEKNLKKLEFEARTEKKQELGVKVTPNVTGDSAKQNTISNQSVKKEKYFKQSKEVIRSKERLQQKSVQIEARDNLVSRLPIIERRRIEQREIQRAIKENTAHEKDERYFERRHEVKDSPAINDSAHNEVQPQSYRTHDNHDVRSKIGISVTKLGTKEKTPSSAVDIGQKSFQTKVSVPTAMIVVGIICALIIIKYIIV